MTLRRKHWEDYLRRGDTRPNPYSQRYDPHNWHRFDSEETARLIALATERGWFEAKCGWCGEDHSEDDTCPRFRDSIDAAMIQGEVGRDAMVEVGGGGDAGDGNWPWGLPEGIDLLTSTSGTYAGIARSTEPPCYRDYAQASTGPLSAEQVEWLLQPEAPATPSAVAGRLSPGRLDALLGQPAPAALDNPTPPVVRSDSPSTATTATPSASRQSTLMETFNRIYEDLIRDMRNAPSLSARIEGIGVASQEGEGGGDGDVEDSDVPF